jgi:hypothetical protein
MDMLMAAKMRGEDDIAAWAATVRLPDAEAAAIFQRITGTPAPAPAVTPRLDPSWWRHLTADFTARPRPIFQQHPTLPLRTPPPPSTPHVLPR